MNGETQECIGKSDSPRRRMRLHLTQGRFPGRPLLAGYC
jgi:hypothetical protein